MIYGVDLAKGRDAAAFWVYQLSSIKDKDMPSLTTQKALAASCQKAAEDAACARAKVHQLQYELHSALSAELEAHAAHEALWNDAATLLAPGRAKAPSQTGFHPRPGMAALSASSMPDACSTHAEQEPTEAELLFERLARPVAPVSSATPSALFVPFASSV